MKRFIIIHLLLLTCLFCQAKYYVGLTTTTVNMRECASTSCPVICKVKMQETVLYNTEEIENGFYKVIYLDKDLDGYIHSNYIKPYQEIVVDENGALQKIGQSADMWPTVSIENESHVTLTLRMNSKSYKIEPTTKRKIVSEPGQCRIIAIAKGAFPYISADVLENNTSYEWMFKIVTVPPQEAETQAYISDEDKTYYHKIADCALSVGKDYLSTVKAAMDSGRKPCPVCYDIKK